MVIMLGLIQLSLRASIEQTFCRTTRGLTDSYSSMLWGHGNLRAVRASRPSGMTGGLRSTTDQQRSRLNTCQNAAIRSPCSTTAPDGGPTAAAGDDAIAATEGDEGDEWRGRCSPHCSASDAAELTW